MRLAAILILLVFCHSIYGQSHSLQTGLGEMKITPDSVMDVASLSTKVYDDQSGLLSNRVGDLVFDAKGYLWAATAQGAAFYNGRIWQHVPFPEAIKNNYSRCAILAGDGAIWFGTNGGVARYKDGQWSGFNDSSGLPNNVVMGLWESRFPDGRSIVWVATRGGLAAYQDSRWTGFHKDNSGIPTNELSSVTETITADGERRLWLGTFGSGVICLSGVVDASLNTEKFRWRSFNKGNSVVPDNTVQSVSSSLSGGGKAHAVWAATNNGIVHIVGEKLTVYGKQDWGIEISGSTVVLETLEPNGRLIVWVGLSSGGIMKLEQGRWIALNRKRGLTDDQIFTIVPMFYSSGYLQSIWIGTRSGGIIRLNIGKWSTIDVSSGLPVNSVNAILQTENSKGEPVFWYGTWGGGLARLEKRVWTTYTIRDGLSDSVVRCLIETVDAAGVKSLWVGTQNGICRYSKGRWTVYNAQNGQLPDNHIYCFMLTGKGSSQVLWAGTMSGLAYFKDGRWSWYSRQNSGIPDNSVLGLHHTYDSSGRETIWVATNGGGLASLTGGEWKVYNHNFGLPSNVVMSVLSTVDENGVAYIWAGTSSGLVVQRMDRLQNTWQTVKIDEQSKLINRAIFQLRQDRNQNIYVFTDKGIVRLKRREKDSDRLSFRTLEFTIEDGLPSNQVNVGGSYVDLYGRIWAGTANGAALIDPEDYFQDDAKHPLYIEQIWLNQSLTEVSDRSLAYNENNLEFEYALLSFLHESETSYKTQLVGFDSAPTGWSKEFKRVYTNLPKGEYTFKVWGKDYLGNITGPVEVRFTIKPAPWLTWWAFLAYGLVASGSFLGAMKWRLRKFEQRNRELEEKVRERTAKLAEANDRLAEAYEKVKLSEMELHHHNMQMMDSIRYAQNIQRAVLYNEEEFADSFKSYFILYRPKDLVSGDFYWYKQNGRTVVIAVADCTGHGVPGALMSMLGTSLLNQLVKEQGITDPREILFNVHIRVRDMLKQDRIDFKSPDGMDMAICRIDYEREVLSFAGAKRPIYCVFADGRVVEIKGDRKSLGGRQREENRQFTLHNFRLEELTAIYLTTDGYADQNGADGRKYGSRRLTELIMRISSLDMEVQKQILLQEISEHMGGEPQRDDITIIGIQL